MAERRPPSGLFPGSGSPSAPDRLRLLVVQSALPPRDAVSEASLAGRFDTTFARDALTVVASVSARETDVVLLDTPLFDVDTDALLLDLERQRGKAPVLVLGGRPPGRTSGFPFAVRHLPKPIDPERLRREIDAAAREAAYERSLPPPPPGRGGDGSSDFLEWSQLALELAEEADELPENVAAETNDDAVEILELALAEAAPPPEAGAAELDAGVPAPAPRRSKPPRPPPPPARGMDLERTLTVEGLDAAAPPLAGRTAAFVGRRTDVATRVALALYAAGVEVRMLEGGLGDVLPGLRESPPDLLVVEPDRAADVARTLRQFRTEVRLWHRPLLLVAADAEAEALLRMHGPGGPDAVVRADAGEAELVAKAGFLLAPAEQARERMLREKVAAGEIGPVGVATLVRLAALARPEGRLVLRGEGRLAEFDLRGSEIAQARLTEPDGRQCEGSDALLLALTIRTGRYSLRPPPVARPSVSLRLPLPQALWDAADRLADLLRRVAPERLPRVRRLRLRDRAGPIRGLSPVELRARERLQTGDAPRVLAGAPGLDAERVALLIEKLALSGDILDVEEDDGGAPAVSEPGDAAVETINATAVEALPAAAPPAPSPIEVSTPFPAPPAAPAESGRPPSSLPAAETAPAPETSLVPEAPSGSSALPFGTLPAEFAPPDAAGPASLGAGGLARLGVAGGRAGARRRARAARLVPIVLVALGAGALAVLHATGRLGSAGPDEPGSGAPAAALASDAGRVAAASAASAGGVEEPDAGGVPSRAPDSGMAVSPAGAGGVEEPDAGRATRPAVGSDATVSVAAGPGATVSPAVGEPDAAAEFDAGRRVEAPADRSAGAVRDAGAASGGPAVLVVPRPEGVAVELVVFVDGVRQGVAPVRVELAAGEHEVRFEAAGQQSLSIVRLRAGERRTVVPRQLLRQLPSP